MPTPSPAQEMPTNLAVVYTSEGKKTNKNVRANEMQYRGMIIRNRRIDIDSMVI
jgi:hypothetical protein